MRSTRGLASEFFGNAHGVHGHLLNQNIAVRRNLFFYK